jgi:FKBP-type peptidyl-prolyl cis-trans isomerase 2
MEVRIGTGEIIPGLESGLMGMKVGETRTFTVSPEDAFGEHDENLCRWMEKELFAEPEGIKVGRMCQVPVTSRSSAMGTVVEVGEEAVLIDLNHPLVGKVLTFEVECMEIRDE